MPKHPWREHAKGMTLVELMIAMAIGLLIVLAVTMIYLSTAQHQRALERRSTSQENGAFVLQLLGREIMNAGFYPATFPPKIADVTQQGMYDTYPPLESSPRQATDWQNSASNWPPAAYMTAIYGCDGGAFDVKAATCPTPDSSKSDTLVVNYFTSDPQAESGFRKDCNGSWVDSDGSNAERVGLGRSKKLAPLLPLFVSNRYTLTNLNNFVDQQAVVTRSLACSGNGANPFNTVSAYQPLIQGIKDLRIRYGVYVDDTSLMPQRFYSATEVSALPSVTILGQSYSGWRRVTSVRVCVLTQSQGGGVRLADKQDAPATYLDCDEQSQQQPSGQWVHRFVQVFGVRNALKQSY